MKESNILIANFLGIEKQEYLNYNESWDMLMQVVEKIKQGEAELNTKGSELLFKVYEALTDINITSTFNACVEFVEWWNKTNKL